MGIQTEFRKKNRAPVPGSLREGTGEPGILTPRAPTLRHTKRKPRREYLYPTTTDPPGGMCFREVPVSEVAALKLGS